MYRQAAEAALLNGNGTAALGVNMTKLMEPIRDDPFYYSTLWDREQWCMAFCLLAAMVKTGDA